MIYALSAKLTSHMLQSIALLKKIHLRFERRNLWIKTPIEKSNELSIYTLVFFSFPKHFQVHCKVISWRFRFKMISFLFNHIIISVAQLLENCPAVLLISSRRTTLILSIGYALILNVYVRFGTLGVQYRDSTQNGNEAGGSESTPNSWRKPPKHRLTWSLLCRRSHTNGMCLLACIMLSLTFR